MGGDGGPATDAQLSYPRDVAANETHLYVAVVGTHQVRAIELDTGLITTIARNGEATSTGDGGPSSDALLSYPTGLALSDEDLFIATAGHRVRRVDFSTGLISTVAAGEAA